jgi:hypothetical protein
MVVGSFRDAETYLYRFSNQDFFSHLAAGLGAWVRRRGHVLRVGWSNDHLLKQARPEVDGLETVTHNADGTLSADPAHCRFLFEETADFHALRGFLGQPTGNGRIELDISDAMYFGSTEHNTLAWEPVKDLKIAGRTIADYVSQGTIERHQIEGSRESELFRSKYLTDVIDPGSQREIDLVIALGGGKASGSFYQAALQQLKLLPLPYCGGESQRLFVQCYARRDSRTLERLTYVFGHDMPEILEDYQMEMVGPTLDFLDHAEKFFHYPYRVFLAFPFGRKDEEKIAQNLVFEAISRAVARVRESAPNFYSGADVIRIDSAIFGTKEIHQEMWHQIRNSGVIMGELTPLHSRGSPNANVFYELGFADGVYSRKPHLLTARKGTTIPFDVGNKKIYQWRDLEELEQICVEQFTMIFNAIRTGT